MKLDIRMISAFRGPRHRRLRRIWEAVALYWGDFVRVSIHPNIHGQRSHAEMFNEMWEVQDSRHLLLTELDFLPNLHAPEWYNPGAAADHLARGATPPAVIACNYATRCEGLGRLAVRPYPGGWWVMLDCDACPAELDFTGRPDPCNQLLDHIAPAALFEGTDCFPRHYGIDYPFGTHLFWSRHLSDDPRTYVGKVCIGDVQDKHDAAVDAWVAAAPANFRKILERCPDAATV